LKLTDMFQHSEIPYEVTVKTEENFFFWKRCTIVQKNNTKYNL
jgi:hypothetical protein